MLHWTSIVLLKQWGFPLKYSLAVFLNAVGVASEALTNSEIGSRHSRKTCCSPPSHCAFTNLLPLLVTYDFISTFFVIVRRTTNNSLSPNRYCEVSNHRFYMLLIDISLMISNFLCDKKCQCECVTVNIFESKLCSF